MHSRLQPCALEAAALGTRGCSPVLHSRGCSPGTQKLQPYVGGRRPVGRAHAGDAAALARERVESAVLMVPQLSALASWGGLPRLLAVLRTRDEQLSRSLA